MAGGIVMVVVLVVVLPVAILMGGAVIAAVLGSLLKSDADARAEGTEALAVSQANHYDR